MERERERERERETIVSDSEGVRRKNQREQRKSEREVIVREIVFQKKKKWKTTYKK